MWFKPRRRRSSVAFFAGASRVPQPLASVPGRAHHPVVGPAGDARSAVVEFLTAPPGRPVRPRADTVEFLKERGGRDRRLLAVRFVDLDGRAWFWLVAAERDEHRGWQAHGVAGGAGAAPRRSGPWLNFCGGWGRGRLYGGGEICEAGVALSRIRLTLANGLRLDDDAEGGVALFVADSDSAPQRIELFDSAGRLAASQAP